MEAQFERLLTAAGKLRRCANSPCMLQVPPVGQFAVDQQVGDLFKLAVRRKVLDVVSAIVQVVAAVPHRA